MAVLYALRGGKSVPGGSWTSGNMLSQPNKPRIQTAKAVADQLAGLPAAVTAAMSSALEAPLDAAVNGFPASPPELVLVPGAGSNTYKYDQLVPDDYVPSDDENEPNPLVSEFVPGLPFELDTHVDLKVAKRIADAHKSMPMGTFLRTDAAKLTKPGARGFDANAVAELQEALLYHVYGGPSRDDGCDDALLIADDFFETGWEREYWSESFGDGPEAPNAWAAQPFAAESFNEDWT